MKKIKLVTLETVHTHTHTHTHKQFNKSKYTSIKKYALLV